MTSKFKITLVALCMASAMSAAAAAPQAKQQAGQKVACQIEEVTMVDNPVGLGFGFWSNGRYSQRMMLDFGRRPYERFGFFGWNAVETAPGVYDVSKIVSGVQEVHSLGSTCIIALNNISGPWFLKDFKSQIPKFYTQDITDKKTRQAGKDYIYNVIKKVLPQTGTLVVCFDYEMMWHCRPDTPAKQKLLHDWFLDEVAVARKAAADLNMSDNLKIIPIVNGSIEDDNIIKLLGTPATAHTPAKWLTDMVAVCDYLAIDSYDFDKTDVTNPNKTVSTIGFWIKYYSLGKPVYVTEFGYSTGVTQYPDYKTAYHAMGTEEQQRDFYGAFLPLLAKENVPGGRLNGQLRSMCFWMYSDSHDKQKSQEREWYFGIVRVDGSHKPSFDVLKAAIDAIESNPATAPSLEKGRVAVTPEMLAAGVSSVFTSGTAFDYFQIACPAKEGSATLTLKTESAGTALAYSAGKWYNSMKAGTTHSFDIELDGTSVKFFLTGGTFPVTQKLIKAELKCKQ